ncbi:S8 family peptidase [Endozoicomonas arenosclerae]|uniref:S8 family peptidase n=1 Tax=Endozoicomonas arenosclerae TaxID=1633495 RepID=UPI0007848983|nr:S8 family peptidase [Endozoicomonas arenosclerae]
MKARIALLLTLLGFTFQKATTQEIEIETAPRQVTDRIIINYHPEPTEGNAIAHIKQGVNYGAFGVAAGRDKEIIEIGGSVNINDAQILADSLEDNPQVAFAEPDYIMQIMRVPNDSRYNEQWHYFESTAGSNLPAAWDITTGRSDVIVGVIDTGIVYHKDIDGNVVSGHDFISHSWIANDGGGRDQNAIDSGDAITSAGACGYSNGQPVPPAPTESSWHGTHVSGTIAAESNNSTGVAGVAWNAKVMPLRALGRCGGYTSDIIDAMRWAAGLDVYGMSRNTNPVKVINMSLGGFSYSCPQSYQNAINEVVSAGVTVVVAAGNENTNVAYATPANCSNVITVGAIDRGGDRSWYSNYGSNVDISAPGGETRYYGNGVLSTANAGATAATQDNYEYYQGTSMATPHVAGVAALMYSINPNLTPARVEEIIKLNARSFSGGTCSTSICGAGILDAGAAVLDARDE